MQLVGGYLRNVCAALQGVALSGHRAGVLLCYDDADWASDNISRRSTTGGVVTLGGDVLSCLAKRQRSVCAVEL